LLHPQLSIFIFIAPLAKSLISSKEIEELSLGERERTMTGAVASVILIICGSLISFGSLPLILVIAFETSFTAVSIFFE